MQILKKIFFRFRCYLTYQKFAVCFSIYSYKGEKSIFTYCLGILVRKISGSNRFRITQFLVYYFKAAKFVGWTATTGQYTKFTYYSSQEPLAGGEKAVHHTNVAALYYLPSSVTSLGSQKEPDLDRSGLF